jgi:hypothetical protein
MVENRIGMYGETPRIKIGQYIICCMNPDGNDKTVWIETLDGIGGEFQESLLETTIEEFFNKYI